MSRQIDTGLVYKAYQVAVSCAVPAAALGFLLSARGRRRYGERFGDWGEMPPVGWWLHGASVGEVQGLLPFVARIKEHAPSDRILLTATSPTGLDRGAPHVDLVRVLPFDASWLVERALARATFDRFVLSETELWPALLRSVLRKGAPCHIINGRVSDYTIRWYRTLQGLFGPLLRSFTSVSVPDEEQRARFAELGVPAERVHVTGHTKYDTAPRFDGGERRREIRESFFPGIADETPIVVLGSVRPGEESWWFGAFERVWREGKSCKVVIAPRHAEKFQHFAALAERLSVSTRRWSSGPPLAGRSFDVVLLDVMGKLEEAYAAADAAFVGATLVDIGGHNPLEPAMYGCPVVVGPYTSVVREVVSEMKRADGIAQVRSADEINGIVERLCARDEALRAVGERGRGVWQTHRGAARRALDVVSRSEESR